MIPKTTLIVGAIGVVCTVLSTAVACSNKAQQPYNDAQRTRVQNDSPATVGNMPDGFSNWSRKCDGPDMVYTIYHNDSPYGGIAVVANDPRCTGGAR